MEDAADDPPIVDAGLARCAAFAPDNLGKNFELSERLFASEVRAAVPRRLLLAVQLQSNEELRPLLMS
jgi:hypothetical protein